MIELDVVCSLFDGDSGGQQALVRAGIKYNKYLASEIDKPAIQITQKNFPDTIQLGDVCGVVAKDLPKDIDLLLAGLLLNKFSLYRRKIWIRRTMHQHTDTL
jgi:DNA (cytosine-5)-methyltransferase 3A